MICKKCNKEVKGGSGDEEENLCDNCNLENEHDVWIEVCISALQELQRPGKMPHLQKDIFPWVEDHWKDLGLPRTASWKSLMSSKLSSRPDIFENSENGHWGLINNDQESQFTDEYETQRVKEPRKKKSKAKNSLDKQGFLWCHQCKQKHTEVIVCSQTCSKKYCTRCVLRHYQEKVDEIEPNGWICYYCQGVCSCAFCRRRRAKETNTKFESHRGKKRKVSDTLPEEKPTKKRKIKSQCHEKSTEETVRVKPIKSRLKEEHLHNYTHDTKMEDTSNIEMDPVSPCDNVEEPNGRSHHKNSKNSPKLPRYNKRKNQTREMKSEIEESSGELDLFLEDIQTTDSQQFSKPQDREDSDADSSGSYEIDNWNEDDPQETAALFFGEYIFENFPKICYEDVERDLLVIEPRQFLDIRDKDFFNISSNDDQSLTNFSTVNA